MNVISTIFSEPLINALGWTIVHSLWQVTLIAFILSILLVFIKKFTAKSRYIISVFAMFAIIGLTLITFIHNYKLTDIKLNAQSAERHTIDVVTINEEQPTTHIKYRSTRNTITEIILRCEEYFNDNLSLIVTIWLFGVVIYTLKTLGGLFYIKKYKNYRMRSVAECWKNKLKELSLKFKIKKSIRLMESSFAKVPMVIGYFKPVILLPASVVSRVPPEQLEAVIIHELAHIYRNDYLINIIQSITEVVYFYHPAMWWISNNIRNEREHCCDDIVVLLSNDSINYAKALVTIQERTLQQKEMEKIILLTR